MPLAHPADPYGGPATWSDGSNVAWSGATSVPDPDPQPYTETDDRLGTLTFVALDDLGSDERW